MRTTTNQDCGCAATPAKDGWYDDGGYSREFVLLLLPRSLFQRRVQPLLRCRRGCPEKPSTAHHLPLNTAQDDSEARRQQRRSSVLFCLTGGAVPRPGDDDVSAGITKPGCPPSRTVMLWIRKSHSGTAIALNKISFKPCPLPVTSSAVLQALHIQFEQKLLQVTTGD